MATRPTPPRDARGRFTKHRRPPLDPALVKSLGQGRSAIAKYFDDAIPWVVIPRHDTEEETV